MEKYLSKCIYNISRIIFLLLNISIPVTLHASIINHDHLVAGFSNSSNSKENKDERIPRNVEEPLILTPYLENNEILEAKNLALVYDKQFLNVLSYAGYFTVDKLYDSNMWFWYVPVADGDVESNPLLIWFQGGPGDTSMYGMFKELGPFKMHESNTMVEANPYSWHRDHSLLFIDNPVGVGFSFTENDAGFSTTLVQVTKNLYETVRQFFMLFPELRNSPLYLAGESYAGKYIPYLATEIHERNPSADIKINLQGLAIGNGFIDPPLLIRTSAIALSYDFINDVTAENLKHDEDEVIYYFDKGENLKGISAWEDYLSKFWEATNLPNIYNYADDHFEDVYLDDSWMHFIQIPEIQEILHVGLVEWDSNKEMARCSLRGELHTSAKHLLENLLNQDYKVMLYSGNLDMMVPYKLSLNSYKSMTWKGQEDYLSAKRRPWNYEGTLAGYVTRAMNFVEVEVRNAGHMVPADQPQRAQALMLAFTRGILFNETAFDIAFAVLPPSNSAGGPCKGHGRCSLCGLQLSLLLIIGLVGKSYTNFL